MEITADKLVQIIGSMQVEIVMLRTEIERMRAAEADKNKSHETVTPLRPSSA